MLPQRKMTVLTPSPDAELSQARSAAYGDPADPEHARLLSKEETEEVAHFSHGNYAIAK